MHELLHSMSLHIHIHVTSMSAISDDHSYAKSSDMSMDGSVYHGGVGMFLTRIYPWSDEVHTVSLRKGEHKARCFASPQINVRPDRQATRGYLQSSCHECLVIPSLISLVKLFPEKIEEGSLYLTWNVKVGAQSFGPISDHNIDATDCCCCEGTIKSWCQLRAMACRQSWLWEGLLPCRGPILGFEMAAPVLNRQREERKDLERQPGPSSFCSRIVIIFC